MNGYHEYSAQNTSVLVSTVLLYLHVRSLMPFLISPCCPPDSIPQAAALLLLFSTCNAIPLCPYTAQVAALFFTTSHVSAAFKQWCLGSEALNFKDT